MSLRLDPRRLAALKLMAAEAGMRPGELVTSWVEERIDAARTGRGRPPGAPGATGPSAASAAAVDALSARVDELARRIEALGGSSPAAAEPTPEPGQAEPPKRRQGRPRKAKKIAAGASGSSRVPLHEEIIEVIRERGPLTASEIATAIAERGRYTAPRSSRPLDGAVVNSRVSNPAYRSRFRRAEGRIDLAS